jgi:hypothetical protein
MAPRTVKKRNLKRRASTVARAAEKLRKSPRRPQKLRPAPIPPPESVALPEKAGTWERAFQNTLIAEEAAKRKKKLAAILKKVKPRKAERDKVIFVTAEPIYKVVKGRRKIKEPAGQRVGRNTRRRVFAFKVQGPTKKHPKGKLVPFYPRRERGLEKKLPPKPIKVHDFDPSYFKSKKVTNWWYQSKQLAEGVEQPRTSLIVGTRKTRKITKRKRRQPVHELDVEDMLPFSIKRERGKKTLDFMDDVVPEVSNLLQQAANDTGEKRDFKVDYWATVKLPDGGTKTVNGFVSFKQADMQQFMDIGFYEPFVARAMYAHMAQALSAEGMVTTGSARYIKQLPHNKNRAMRDWKDARGNTWKGMHKRKGADMDQVQLLRFDIAIEKVLTFSRD